MVSFFVWFIDTRCKCMVSFFIYAQRTEMITWARWQKMSIGLWFDYQRCLHNSFVLTSFWSLQLLVSGWENVTFEMTRTTLKNYSAFYNKVQSALQSCQIAIFPKVFQSLASWVSDCSHINISELFAGSGSCLLSFWTKLDCLRTWTVIASLFIFELH